MHAPMKMEWGSYRLYVPVHVGLVEEMSRADAREAYEDLMAARLERQRELSGLLAANGLVLSDSDAGIRELDAWFVNNVEGHITQPERLRDVWYSVVNDIGLFLGDVLTKRAPQLHWTFWTAGKRHVSFQRHVISGFTRTFPGYCLDPDAEVAILGVRATMGYDFERNRLPVLIRRAMEIA